MPWQLTELLFLYLMFRSDPSEGFKTNVTIGYIADFTGSLSGRVGMSVSGALTMAIEHANNNSELLRDVWLNSTYADMRGDRLLSLNYIIKWLQEGVKCFIGSEGYCFVQSLVIQSQHLPMISHKCLDSRASEVNTFARTNPSYNQVIKSLISLLRYYNWKRFQILYEKTWEPVAMTLAEQARDKNFTVNPLLLVSNLHDCCSINLPCCQNGYWYQIIQETRNITRIYVFLGNNVLLNEMMNTMHALKMFDNGEYMVITVDMQIYSISRASQYIWVSKILEKSGSTCHDAEKEFLKRGRSLLVVVSRPPNETLYREFTEQVLEYNKKRPFSLSLPPIFGNLRNGVPIYAAYLYDAVMLYARALDGLLKEYDNVTEDIINSIVSNGTLIIEKLKNHTYYSVTGNLIKLDHNADSEGNFSVAALKPHDFRSPYNFTCDYMIVPVASFQLGDNPEYKPECPANWKLYPDSDCYIEWPGGRKPDDEPVCGYYNEKCESDTTAETILTVVAIILSVVLFCTLFIIPCIYRQWERDLLWIIDPNDIYWYPSKENVSSRSRPKMSSITAPTKRSCYGFQVSTANGEYKGVKVRIKELKFSKRKVISGDPLKEMRILKYIHHDNINSFIGASFRPMHIFIIMDFCAKGSLCDIVENEDIKLDMMFKASLIHDLIKGMLYIHDSEIGFHGNLKSSNCVITSRWVLQITDFGLYRLRHRAESDSIGEHQYYHNMLWKAPELLRDLKPYDLQKADLYAFAIIIYEIIGRQGPFGITHYDPKDIVEQVRQKPSPGIEPFRPDIEMLRDLCVDCPYYILSLIQVCWAENPNLRPSFPSIQYMLKKLKKGKHQNIVDHMMDMMEKYANNLEDLVKERTCLLIKEKLQTEDLLNRMLPRHVTRQLAKGIAVEPEFFDLVTLYFSDIVGFSVMSAESTPFQVINFLNDLYTLFDKIIKGYDVYKVETIGNACMVASGLPLQNGDRHAGEIASMSLELLEAVRDHHIAHCPTEVLKLRIGIHTGPVVAGVVGLTMPRYCLFGDTVITASFMESSGEPLKIHISPQCRDALHKIGGYIMEDRGVVHMKGKGAVNTYWLIGATEKAIQKKEVDLTRPPPLFCRPQNNPQLTANSQQAVLCGGSHRQSGVTSGINTQDSKSHSFKNYVGSGNSSVEDTRAPLSGNNTNNYPTLQKEALQDYVPAKRWHSLQDIAELESIMVVEGDDSKEVYTPQGSIPSLLGLFNDDDLHTSDGDLQCETIV